MFLFCTIDKIMLADSKNQGRKDIIFGEMYLENGPDPMSPCTVHVGNISLNKFDTFLSTFLYSGDHI